MGGGGHLGFKLSNLSYFKYHFHRIFTKFLAHRVYNINSIYISISIFLLEIGVPVAFGDLPITFNSQTLGFINTS